MNPEGKWAEPTYLEVAHPTSEPTKLLNFYACPDDLYLVVFHKVFAFVQEDGSVVKQILEEVD